MRWMPGLIILIYMSLNVDCVCYSNEVKYCDDLQRRSDLLQLILEARTGQESVSLEHFDTTNKSDETDYRSQQTQPRTIQQKQGPKQDSPIGHPQKKTITNDEIVAQAFVVLLGGYETSCNTLSFTCYLLANHPDCQRKLQEEVDEFFTRHVSLIFWSNGTFYFFLFTKMH